LRFLSKKLAFCFALFAFCTGAPLYAATEFQTAAQLLSAARAGNAQTVQALVNAGANVNYVDNTGLSIVCTALMNNDIKAAQILQVYGADASKCDQQIKRYNQRLPKEESGGLFSGLSTAQNMTLAAAGAAVVVGGVWLLVDLLGGPGNNNGGGPNNDGTGRGKGGGGNSGGTGGTVTETAALPKGPAELAPLYNYKSALDQFSPKNPAGSTTVRDWDFAYMSASNKQNYLLMMHGYSPLARGYAGQKTLRLADRTPLVYDLTNSATGDTAGGGRPVLTALITANGVNASGSATDGWITWAGCAAGTEDACTAAETGSGTVSRKFFNNKFTAAGNDSTVSEDIGFDLSGSGTVFNPYASSDDSALAKIIAGWENGQAPDVGDYYGFMPNGQLAVYRTGGGRGFVSVTPGAPVGTMIDVNNNDNWDTGDTITVGGNTYTITVNGSVFSVAGLYNFSGYIGADGLLYVNSTGGGIDSAYAIDSSGNVTLNKQLQNIDYMNYRAMLNASSSLNSVGNPVASIANAAMPVSLLSNDSETITDMAAMIAGQTTTDARTIFTDTVNKYYDNPIVDSYFPGTDAGLLFGGAMGAANAPMLIFGTGGYTLNIVNGHIDGQIQEASFENFAPALYENLNHKFMSVVAVQYSNGSGTTNVDTVSGYDSASGMGKIGLATWTDGTDVFASRACGMAGRANGTTDPWCFAAAGANSDQAVAAMAGAFGAAKGAFSYMSNEMIFRLLALTADGYMLGTDAAGNTFSEAALIEYLSGIYTLPGQYQYRVASGESYLSVFAEIYGYGLVNLERATRAGTKLHFFTSDDRIVSSSGKAYWRQATVNSSTVAKTAVSLGSAFGAQGALLMTPVFDFVESVDRTASMPRIFENTISLANNRRALSANLLADFKIDDGKDLPIANNKSPIAMSVSFRDSTADDGYGNLDELSLGYSAGAWSFGAKYERNMGGANIMRGDAANPVLSLASNAVSTDVKYGTGAWSVAFRGWTGAITEEGLMENDPALSGRYTPMRLGSVSGGEFGVVFDRGVFSVASIIGFMDESETMLGSYSDGLLAFGAGETAYIDSVLTIRASEKLQLNARYTAAQTKTNATGEFILGMSDLRSDAMSVGVEFGGWSFNVSRPLAVTRGHLQYASADYDLVESDTGFDLVANPYARNLDLAAHGRETRFSAAYRAKFNDWTSGALGFIYRSNPNHTDEFGDETILMFKLNHKLGI
jgi:hypothetical protein